MNTTELKTLATAGVANRIKDIEAELAGYHKDWPHLFLSPTAPQLLKAQTKASGNGHFPKIVATKPDARKGGWTDERRAKFSATMKAKYAGKKRRNDTRLGSEAHRAKIRASWTPERRAKMARLMKKRSKAMHAAKRAQREAH